MTEANYERLEESLTDQNAPESQVDVPPINQQTAPISTKSLKKEKILKILVFATFTLGILMTIFGVACVAHGVGCELGSGIWVGVFAIVSASMGIAAIRNPYSRRLLIVYFVLCILVTILSFELIVVSSYHADYAHNILQDRHSERYKSEFFPGGFFYEFPKGAEVGLGINVTLALLAVIHFICAIVASSLICTIWSRNGCCNTAEQYHAPPVVFIQCQPGLSHQPQAFIIQQDKTQAVPTYVAQQRMVK